MKDMHNRLSVAVALDQSNITSDTTTAGNIIDRAGDESLEFVPFTGTITDGDYTVLVEHGDDSGLSDAAAVPDTQLLGTEAGASFTADTDDDSVSKIGYVGDKRYVRVSIVSTNTTTGGNIGVVALLGHPRHTADEPV